MVVKFFFCQSCSKPVKENQVFCGQCGVRLWEPSFKEALCCGIKYLISGDRPVFCIACGAKLERPLLQNNGNLAGSGIRVEA